jgi:hypothetical protein
MKPLARSCLHSSRLALVPSFPHSRLPSFPHSLIPAFPRSLVPSFPRSLVLSFPPSLVPPFLRSPFGMDGFPPID